MKKLFSLASTSFLVAALAGCATSGLDANLKYGASSLSTQRALSLGRSYIPLAKMAKIGRMSKSARRTTMASLPVRIDLRKGCTPITSQGSSNACSAFASVDGLSEFLAKKQGKPMDYSPRFIWNLVRKDTGELEQNAGVDYRDAVKKIAAVGLIPETAFPFPTASQQADASAFSRSISEVPSPALVAEAARHRLFKEARVLASAEEMKESVAAGMPVVFGIAVFPNVDQGKNGEIPLPKKGDQAVGGHIMLCVGYDEGKQQFIVRNSWGATWGDQGYGYLPYAYIQPEWAHVGMTAGL